MEEAGLKDGKQPLACGYTTHSLRHSYHLSEQLTATLGRLICPGLGSLGDRLCISEIQGFLVVVISLLVAQQHGSSRLLYVAASSYKPCSDFRRFPIRENMLGLDEPRDSSILLKWSLNGLNHGGSSDQRLACSLASIAI